MDDFSFFFLFFIRRFWFEKLLGVNDVFYAPTGALMETTTAILVTPILILM